MPYCRNEDTENRNGNNEDEDEEDDDENVYAVQQLEDDDEELENEDENENALTNQGNEVEDPIWPLLIDPSLLNYHILAGQPTSVLLARKSFPRKYVISFHSFSRELQIDNRK